MLRAVLQWLISDCQLFGLPSQNWMWVLPSALLLYIAVLIVIRRRQVGAASEPSAPFQLALQSVRAGKPAGR